MSLHNQAVLIIHSSFSNTVILLDLVNRNLSQDSRLRKCFELEQKWLLQGVDDVEERMEATTALANAIQRNSRVSSRTAVFPSITCAMEWIWGCAPGDEKPATGNWPEHPIRMRDSSHVQVLVTGSFHLVGGVLKCLGPDAFM